MCFISYPVFSAGVSSPQKMLPVILLVLFFSIYIFFNTLKMLSAHLHIRLLLIHQDVGLQFGGKNPNAMPDTYQTEDWTKVWGSVVQGKYSLKENKAFCLCSYAFWLPRRAMMEVLSGSYSRILTGAFCNLLLARLRYLNVLHLILPLGRQSALYKSCSAFSATLEPLTAARVTIPLFPVLFFWTVARILSDTKAPDCNRSCVFQYICESVS